MRGIKFRAWSSAGTYEKAKKQMHYFDLGSKLATVYGNVEHVMQATGLKDKNGKEIYEGDVLLFPDLKAHMPFAVEWEADDAKFTQWSPRDEVEIIGNIYENPDLLK